MSTTAATILASNTHIMKSKHTDKDYRITISLPLGYFASPDAAWPFHNTPSQWPVVYVLDGDWYIGMVTDMVRPTSWCGATGDAIVVGIGYPEQDNPMEAFRESFTRRNFDLTPARDAAEEESMAKQFNRPVPMGGAAHFLNFIQDDVIPFVEKEYRADPSQRILAGHSYGGLFAAFAMFTAPSTFASYIIGSPTLAQGDRFVFNQEAAFAKDNKQPKANVYLYAGDEEYATDTTLTDTLRFDAVLRSRDYEGMVVKKNLFLDQNHCQVVVPGFQWALNNALKK